MQKAQLSLNIYDTEGEDNMVLYLAFVQRYPENSLWDQSLICTLPDRSWIVVSNDDSVEPETTFHYNFHWEENGEPMMAHRPTRHSGKFEVPEPCQTALSWPNTNSIQLRILERATEEAQERLGQETSQYDEKRDGDYLLSLMQRKAPSARTAVNRAIDNNSQPDSIMSALEAFEQDWVDDAIEIMDDADYEALVQMMVDALAA